MNFTATDLTYLKNSKAIHYILGTLQKNGFLSYIAGGAVRDMVLQRLPNDCDILTNASMDKINSLFSDQKITKAGKTFPVYIVNGIEVSSSRGDKDIALFLESDLGKRDFTINAMAYDPIAKEIIDPFNGKNDLKNSIIKFTNNPEKRIMEDPVRMVRACRFAAMINGDISQASLEAILACKALLDSAVAKERIGHEIIKAMALEKPSLFFKALKQTELLSKIFPSLDRCYGFDGGPHHGETLFEHCMLVGDAISPKFPVLRLAGFLHDVGKFDAAITKNNKLTFPGHEKYTKNVVNDLTKLKFSIKDISYIKSLIKSHMRPLAPETTPKAARKLLAMLDSHNLDYKDFMRMRIADKKGNLFKNPYTLSEIKIRLKKLFVEMSDQSSFNINMLRLKGDDIAGILDIPPGPEIGRIKQILFEKVLDDPELNNYDDLKKLCLSLKTEK
ncbi:MAG: HD domain-containing protein [Thermodesulfobacteriota bacterium]